jgi:branched-chain amino acid transport system permease protein
LIQLIINIILSASIYLLIANSYSLIYYPTKFFNIAHAAVISCSAYFVFTFTTDLSFPFPVSIGLAIISATLIGSLCEILVYRKMRKNKVSSLAYLIASIGLYVILQNCISLFWGDYSKIINSADVTIGHQFFNAYISTIQIITVIASIALSISIIIFLHFTSIGKSIRAVSSNPELCNIYGISSNRIIQVAFIIGSSLAAAAGILSALDTNMTPTFGFNLLLYGIVAMIIGGVGSIRGLIAGSLLVATAQHLAAYYIDTKWMDAVTYIILILFLIWKPLGFSGKRLKKVEV